VERHRLPGVEVEPYLTRHYPHGELLAHVVGYIGRIDQRDLARLDRDQYRATSHVGKTGVERRWEHLLHGQAGLERVETNAQGRVLRVLERTHPEPGADLHLTLDLDLQARRSKRSASAPARWSCSRLKPAKCWPWSATPASTPTCSCTAFRSRSTTR
jgi:cell division protein FtsI/penicillin-binding protein 2